MRLTAGRGAFLLLLAAALLAGRPLGPTGAAGQQGAGVAPPNFKVAFIGDQAINANAVAVLQLIQNEGADMVIDLGDLGYGNETDPQTAIDWNAQITSVLGADFPYFAAIGNHDVGNWTTYRQLLLDRLALVSDASCSGDYGIMAACTYQGLFFILSGAGTSPNAPDYAPHVDYIRDELAQDTSIWRICAWHKNQNAMQVGSKADEVGWGSYEECRQGRAIVATAHEHSYERTKTLVNTQTQAVDPAWPDAGTLRVAPGATFAFVSGLGGNSIRNQDRCLPTTPPYGCNGEWASINTSDQGAAYGALFIEFHVDGDPTKANAYFKDIDGDVVDTFTIISDQAVGGTASLPHKDAVPGSGVGFPVAASAAGGGAPTTVVLAALAWYGIRRRTRQ